MYSIGFNLAKKTAILLSKQYACYTTRICHGGAAAFDSHCVCLLMISFPNKHPAEVGEDALRHGEGCGVSVDGGGIHYYLSQGKQRGHGGMQKVFGAGELVFKFSDALFHDGFLQGLVMNATRAVCSASSMSGAAAIILSCCANIVFRASSASIAPPI